MGKISGTRGFVLRVMGNVPPGVDDETIRATVMDAVSIASTLLPVLKNVVVDVVDLVPGADGGGSRIVI